VYCVVGERVSWGLGAVLRWGGVLSHVRGVDRLYGLAGSSGGCPVLGVTPYTCTLCWTLSRSWYPVVWPALEGGDMGAGRGRSERMSVVEVEVGCGSGGGRAAIQSVIQFN
jgi:hypothetical protein